MNTMLGTIGRDWLGAARSWIQSFTFNGSDVTWDSNDTLKDIEVFAAKIASVACAQTLQMDIE